MTKETKVTRARPVQLEKKEKRARLVLPVTKAHKVRVAQLEKKEKKVHKVLPEKKD